MMMKHVKLIVLITIVFGTKILFAQQTVGLFSHTPEAFDGYTLFAPIKSETTYLINNCGEKVHSWTSQYQPGLSCYLMENGALLRTGKVPGPGGGSGIVEMIDWDGNVIWDYTIPPQLGKQHHDIELLPNGNILIIASAEISLAEVIQAGSSTTLTEIKSEQIIEVQPNLDSGGGTVVWTWKAWEHLIQDADPTKDNYGNISQSPERIDVNFLNHSTADWLHVNGVGYNAEFDQIIISVHNFSEFWIIDHSTTTAQAASSAGGAYGQGGDLLYRWGNPQAYDQGTANDQKLFLQHHTQWIPESHPDGGKIIMFNNQAGTLSGQDYSSVGIVNLPVDANGFYTYEGAAYAPAYFDWSYIAPTPTDFYSHIISGVQRLENGNTLICEGVTGRFFEVNENKEVVWQYINPVNNNGPMVQGTMAEENSVFRCTRYASNYPGLNGQILSPQGYIETGSTFDCTLITSVDEEKTEPNILVYPNPTQNNISISSGYKLKTVSIYNSIGVKIIDLAPNQTELTINTENLSNGIYYINYVTINEDTSLTKIIIAK